MKFYIYTVLGSAFLWTSKRNRWSLSPGIAFPKSWHSKLFWPPNPPHPWVVWYNWVLCTHIQTPLLLSAPLLLLFPQWREVCLKMQFRPSMAVSCPSCSPPHSASELRDRHLDGWTATAVWVIFVQTQEQGSLNIEQSWFTASTRCKQVQETSIPTCFKEFHQNLVPTKAV